MKYRVAFASPHNYSSVANGRTWVKALWCHLQVNELRPYFAVFDQDLSHRDRQVEAPRPGAPGVQVDHAVSHLHRRFMRMTVDDRGYARGRRDNVEGLRRMRYGKQQPPAFHGRSC